MPFNAEHTFQAQYMVLNPLEQSCFKYIIEKPCFMDHARNTLPAALPSYGITIYFAVIDHQSPPGPHYCICSYYSSSSGQGQLAKSISSPLPVLISPSRSSIKPSKATRERYNPTGVLVTTFLVLSDFKLYCCPENWSSHSREI